MHPGTDATASITGDVPDKVLNLGIPWLARQERKETKETKATLTRCQSAQWTRLLRQNLATATITGTSPNQTLSLGIPKGDKGDKGNTGDAATIEVGTVTTLDGWRKRNGRKQRHVWRGCA